MSVMTLVIGESGTGKSSSLRMFNPDDCLLIQAIKKPLPFKASGWKRLASGVQGNIYTSDQTPQIINAMQKTTRKIIIIDDFQYTMANEFMRRVADKETGNAAFAKYNEIAKNAWDIFNAASKLSDDVRVYVLMHSQSDDFGKTKAKTIGKLLDDKITIEGLFSIVFKTVVRDGQYFFSTKNNGNDTVKTPIGLFDDDLIENDLSLIDSKIVDYYELTTEQ